MYLLLLLTTLTSFTYAQTSPDYKSGIVRHIVLFRYNQNINVKEKQEIKKRFLELKKTCQRNGKPYILSIEAGSQNSPEGVGQGMEHGFIVSFKSQGDRNYYVNQDPIHDVFKKFVGPTLDQDGVIVFDFSL